MTSGTVRRGLARPGPIAALACLCALAASPVIAARSAGQPKGHGGKARAVKLRIATDSQDALLNSGAISVEVRGKGKVALSAAQGANTDLVNPTTVKVRRKPKTVALTLTQRGKDTLGNCGPQDVTVKGDYKRKRHGKRKKRTALATATLAAPSSGCRLHLDVANPDRCDPIDAADCLAPYPNDYFTVPDGGTASGRRLNINPASTPKNVNGAPAFSSEFNRNDGFSPENIILTRVPGIETPAAFKANHLVPQVDIGRYDDPGQRVLLIDAATGQQVPIWSEVDMVPGTPNPHAGNSVNGTVDDRLLLIHPAVQLDYGHRYLVALRNLTNAGGVPLDPNPVFKAYRDSVPTDNAAVEGRRPQMEDILSRLSGAGVSRSSLNLAWDFTVASRDNLTKRLLAMRDDAFAQLGDTNLTNDKVDGTSPPVSITSSTDLILCGSDGTPQCELKGRNYPGYSGTGPNTGDTYTGTSQSHYVFRVVSGTITVPCYMDAPGNFYNPGDPNTPCATGSRLHYDSGADVPSQNGSATWQAPFTCTLPRSGVDAPTGATGTPGLVFGHGLLGDHRTVESLSLYPAAMAGAACGTNWIGLSAFDSVTGTPYPGGDLTFLLNMLSVKKDLSMFSSLPDRSQQGFINALYLGRAMAAADGLTSHTEFETAPATPAFSIDPNNVSDDLSYDGISLGGIFGAATTAVAPDWRRAVLGVPGVGFTTLLSRSTQFTQFLPQVLAAYPGALSREIGISMMQLVWDRGEPSASLPHLTDDPLPGTPPHKVMIQESFGDHQVANIQTETMARTLDAAVRTPVVNPTRPNDINYLFSDTNNPFYTPSQPLITNDDLNDPGGYAGSPAVLYTLDTGSVRTEAGQIVGSNPNLDWDIAPVDQAGLANPNDGRDPHAPGATSPAAQEMTIPFLAGGGYYDPCVTPAPPDIPPYAPPYIGTPDFCTAPPVPSLGQGL